MGSGDVFRVELACHHQLKALFGQDGTSPRSREASDNAWVICPHQAFSIPSSLCGQQDRTLRAPQLRSLCFPSPAWDAMSCVMIAGIVCRDPRAAYQVVGLRRGARRSVGKIPPSQGVAPPPNPYCLALPLDHVESLGPVAGSHGLLASASRLRPL